MAAAENLKQFPSKGRDISNGNEALNTSEEIASKMAAALTTKPSLEGKQNGRSQSQLCKGRQTINLKQNGRRNLKQAIRAGQSQMEAKKTLNEADLRN